MKESASIGELAKETGVKIVTIRYYESIGVLPPPNRSQSNYRIYSREHSRVLRFIRRSRELGFALDQIRDMLSLVAIGAPSCADICAISANHLDAVEEKIRDLKRLASELRRINASCSGRKAVSECRILEALSA